MPSGKGRRATAFGLWIQFCIMRRVHGALLSQGAVQEGDHLGAVAVGIDAELGGGNAVGHAVINGPVDGILVPGFSLHIGEAVGAGGLGLVQVAPQEGDGLGAVGHAGGIEGGGGGTVGDALLHGPQDGAVVPVRLGDIGEGVLGGGGSRLACGTPQHGDDLGTEQLALGIEGSLGSTGGDALLNSPLHGIEVVFTNGDISEGSFLHDIAAGAFAVDEVVAQSRDDLLSDNDLTANAALLALSQAGLGAGSLLTGDDFLGVAQSGALIDDGMGGAAVDALGGLGAVLGAGGIVVADILAVLMDAIDLSIEADDLGDVGNAIGIPLDLQSRFRSLGQTRVFRVSSRMPMSIQAR